jgi:hypothetical protein
MDNFSRGRYLNYIKKILVILLTKHFFKVDAFPDMTTTITWTFPCTRITGGALAARPVIAVAVCATFMVPSVEAELLGGFWAGTSSYTCCTGLYFFWPQNLIKNILSCLKKVSGFMSQRQAGFLPLHKAIAQVVEFKLCSVLRVKIYLMVT